MRLTKTVEPADYDTLAPQLQVIDQIGVPDQTPEARRWEYALALEAIRAWREQRGVVLGLGVPVIYDVGGAHSRFAEIVHALYGAGQIIDGAEPGSWSLEDYVTQHPPLASAVCCLSVLEHVEDLDRFLYHLACLTAPGGLLVLTMDCLADDPDLRLRACGCWPADTAHFHWMRQRIFTPWRIQDEVAEPLLDYGFRLFGEADWQYHGHTLYGSYSIASLVLVKRA